MVEILMNIFYTFCSLSELWFEYILGLFKEFPILGMGLVILGVIGFVKNKHRV